MYTPSLLLLAVSSLSLTAALPTLPERATCTSPTTFTINGFSTFTPATGNPVPSSVYFGFSDDHNSTSRTQCSRTGDIHSTVPALCADGRTSFTYVGNTLTVGELVTSCTTGYVLYSITYKSSLLTNYRAETRVFGSLSLSTYCIPSQPPQPNGYGTQCLTPTGQVSGSFK
jgi:hypothetical protein